MVQITWGEGGGGGGGDDYVDWRDIEQRDKKIVKCSKMIDLGMLMRF